MDGYGYVDSYGLLPYKQEPAAGEPPWYNDKHYSEGIKVPYTDKCYRLALMPDQGIGWSEYDGPEWVWPEGRVGALKIIDPKGRVAWLIWDSEDGKPYLLANRNGPAGSGIEKVYVDKKGSYGGTEIPCQVSTKEIRTPEEDDIMMETGEIRLRPMLEENKGASGYTDFGMRQAQQVDASAHLDGGIVQIAKNAKITLPDGVISYDKKVRGTRIRIVYDFAASEFRFVLIRNTMLKMPGKAPPQDMITTEQEQQNEFGLPILWLSRGKTPTINRATGILCGGSIVGMTDGPDGLTSSAMAFGLTTGLTYATSLLPSDFSISFSVSNITSTTIVLVLGAAIATIVYTGGAYRLRYSDASGTYTKNLTWNGSGFTTVAITRSSDVLTFKENGVQIDSFTLPSIETIGGSAQVMPNNMGTVHDLRVLAQCFSTLSFKYYYDDIVNNSGNAFLPVW